MGLKSDNWIKQMADEYGMIAPFESKQVQKGVISYGASGYGYDMRISNEYAHPDATEYLLSDPKATQRMNNVVSDDGRIVIPKHSFIQVKAFEALKMPKNVQAFSHGKSTYARLGLIVNAPPMDAGYEGTPTLCLVNPTKYSIFVYAFEGITALSFWEADDLCDEDYGSKGGKYQGIHDVQTSLIKNA